MFIPFMHQTAPYQFCIRLVDLSVMAKPKQIHRRELIKWSVPLVASLPFAGALLGCDNKAKQNEKDLNKSKKTASNNRPKPNTTEILYYNPKTKVLHFPGMKEKEKLQTETLEQVKIAEWERMLDSGEAKFAKETSGLAFEKLSLRNYQTNPSTESIEKSLAITARIFSKDYALQNRFNWREYDLLLQWVALNESIVPTEKWNSFSNIIREVNLSKVKVKKRMAWVQSQNLFDKRTAYINEHKNDYLARLKSRLI